MTGNTDEQTSLAAAAAAEPVDLSTGGAAAAALNASYLDDDMSDADADAEDHDRSLDRDSDNSDLGEDDDDSDGATGEGCGGGRRRSGTLATVPSGRVREGLSVGSLAREIIGNPKKRNGFLQSLSQHAGWAVAAAGGGAYLTLLTSTAGFAHGVYSARQRRSAREERNSDEWHSARTRMLHDVANHFRPHPDLIIDQMKLVLPVCLVAIMLPAVADIWHHIRSFLLAVWMASEWFPSEETLMPVPKDLAENAFVALQLTALVYPAALMLYRQTFFVSSWTPSWMLSGLFLLRRISMALAAFSAAMHATLLLRLIVAYQVEHAAVSSIVVRFTLMLTATSSLLHRDHVYSKSLRYSGRAVLGTLILAGMLGLANISFRAIATSVGILGQVTLLYIVEKREAQRKIALWCFDDILQAMRPVADEHIEPHEKLNLVTPGAEVCSAIVVMSRGTAISIGGVLGLLRAVWPLGWWACALIILIGGLVLQVLHRSDLRTTAWNRWRILIPEREAQIERVESIWNAFFLEKAKFSVQPLPAPHGDRVENDAAQSNRCISEDVRPAAVCGIRVVLDRPWVATANAYRIVYKSASAAPSADWQQLASGLVTRNEFERMVGPAENPCGGSTANGSGTIDITGLCIDSEYDVRVDALTGGLDEADRNMVQTGVVRRCRASSPSLTLTCSDDDPNTLELALSTSPDPSLDYAIRYCRDGLDVWHTWAGDLRISRLQLDGDGRLKLPGLTLGASYRVQMKGVPKSGSTVGSRWLPVEPYTYRLTHAGSDVSCEDVELTSIVPARFTVTASTNSITIQVEAAALAVDGVPLARGTSSEGDTIQALRTADKVNSAPNIIDLTEAPEPPKLPAATPATAKNAILEVHPRLVPAPWGEYKQPISETSRCRTRSMSSCSSADTGTSQQNNGLNSPAPITSEPGGEYKLSGKENAAMTALTGSASLVADCSADQQTSLTDSVAGVAESHEEKTSQGTNAGSSVATAEASFSSTGMLPTMEGGSDANGCPSHFVRYRDGMIWLSTEGTRLGGLFSAKKIVCDSLGVCTISGLTPATTYEVQVCTALGGQVSDWGPTPPATVITAARVIPANFTVIPAASSAFVRLEPQTGSCIQDPVLTHFARYRVADSKLAIWYPTFASTPLKFTKGVCILDKLTPGTVYEVQVYATNAANEASEWTPATPKKIETHVFRRATVLYDCEPEHSYELRLVKGDEITQIENIFPEDADWKKGTVGRNSGLFLSSYVEFES